jgi:hypothetical protein
MNEEVIYDMEMEKEAHKKQKFIGKQSKRNLFLVKAQTEQLI